MPQLCNLFKTGLVKIVSKAILFLQEHQKEDWRGHKKLCSYLATAAEEVGADNFFGQEFRLDEDGAEVQEEVKDDDDNAERGDEVGDVENELKNLDLTDQDEGHPQVRLDWFFPTC